ncbi:lon-related putative ATP-dependent protease [Geosporobacter subterraneus DSM 17957]|uniref:endopeptidase La n=1 Tax=Geosporobacter subterraneus DSM 17957 TaxID=1121919 RepID=A0A1M6DB10_9FIRM|nr:ATP-binding protein [Geosporobacter subterraneus]SHI70291.1 lon-related putative ATP-dependent protease [Geosporobacter subterraneus DSM 17957]
MLDQYKVPVDKLKNKCDIGCFDFNTTADLYPLQGIIGQKRAADALEFGLDIKKKGYNIFVSGLSGTGRNSYVISIAEKKAESKETPDDWIYVHNFKNPDSPIALSLKNGSAKHFKKEIENMIEILQKEIPQIFLSKEYENKKSVLVQQYQNYTQQIIDELNVLARSYDFMFTQTERGLMSVPLKEGRPMSEEEYRNLSPQEVDKLRQNSNQLSLETIDVFNKLRALEEEYRNRIKQLDEKSGFDVVDFYINQLKEKFGDRDAIIEFLELLEDDIVGHIDKFKSDNGQDLNNPFAMFQMRSTEAFFDRYRVNLFIDNSEKKGAPIINETNPTYYNLLGRIEYKNELGVMKTDFTEVKAGALHQANGGYLILQAKDLLTNPFAWNALKRALKTNEIMIEGLDKQVGYVVTSTLKPQPIPLDIKVIIVGDPYTYYLLYSYDEDFKKLFKIMADFDIEMERSEENIYKMARFIATHCEKEGLRHFDKSAVGRMIEYSSRLAEDQYKLSSRFNQVVEILYEADRWAEMMGSDHVSIIHVEKAIAEKIQRNNKYEEKTMEMFEDGTLLLEVEGEKVGEINGLAVTGTGEYSFGKPSKITVTTYKGKSGIINIEREVRKSGSIHDKGVLILSGYIGDKFAQNKHLSLSANIVFEQLYSGVDGDSASSTELYALLSSLSRIPIKQYIAVTGSVNQRGQIQPIGGVNEKIEGFFRVCKLKGLNGKQGVMIPHQNVKNLMLSDEVLKAVEHGLFNIYAIKTVEEGIEILTGVPAGTLEESGEYTENSVYDLVDKQLKKFLEEDEIREADKLHKHTKRKGKKQKE